ncbi:Ig-like domain-containing protein [Adhaeretor mobilis]|uniref:VWFA domain-containing protein n=1 Tax=Adhaeretor mobilis TaxID=1930276 RepID=A0A517MYD5_9BACT|nr:Ig-like domain-containing protein [Adhaeretor mobilis]QDS99895.1 hypothetical protein HG15A2_32260 [Adhaeretor mobilis]
MSFLRRDWFGRNVSGNGASQLAKGVRRKASRSTSQPNATRLGVEQLEDRRMLAILVGGGAGGGGDDLEALNDQAPPAGQNVGFEPTVAIENFRLNDGVGDTQDVFIYRASSTGKLLVSSVTDGFAGFTLDVQDSAGNSLLGGAITQGQDRTLPVIESQIYYVVATDTTVDAAGGVYTIDLSNSLAPTPANVSLSPASDTGASNSDGITGDNTPTFFIQDDIASFLPALPAGTNLGAIDSNGANGYDVELVATNLTTGAQTVVNATRLGTSATWTVTTPVLPDAQYLISARTRVDDATSAGAGGANTGFSQLSVPIFVTIDAVADPVTGTIVLTPTSDTGMLSTDGVTKINEPSFVGVGPENSTVRLFAQPLTPAGAVVGSPVLVATGTVGSDNTDNVAGDGQGAYALTSDPLTDGRYSFFVQFETDAGLLSPQIALPTDLFIDTVEPNTPFLDLTSDTGRSDADEITQSSLPTFVMRSNATLAGGAANPFANDVKFRLYARPDGNIGAPETLVYDSFTDATLGGGFTTLASLTRTVSLTINDPAGAPFPDGVHNFTLEIEDRAGNISHDFLLPVTIDTTAPTVNFGQPATDGDGLFDGSDTGVNGTPATFADRITSDTTPTVWGIAEANSVVMLFHDTTGNGFTADDTFLGQTVSNPLDGNLAFPAGYWQISSALNLKQLNGGDGAIPLLAIAQDVAGNVLPPTTNIDALTILLDTQGPQIDAVTVVGATGYDLFDPKPSVNGPTPLINALQIDIVDLPARVVAAIAGDPNFEYAAFENNAFTPGNFQLVGDHVGIIPIESITPSLLGNVNGQPATGSIVLAFAQPLPDDRFTLTILDNISDAAGNALDGESNASEPLEDPTFPTGDGIPGGNFVARFTVDSRPEIGSFVAQNIDLDINGNFVWDPTNAQIGNDATNVDLTFNMNVADPATGAIAPGGYSVHDLVFAGLFGGGGGVLINDNAVFVIDISGSTTSNFGGDPVGDVNGDGSANEIIDAEIAAFKVLNQQLIDRGLGNTAKVSLVAFESAGSIIDVDPVTAGVQTVTTPLADLDSNGMRDIEEALMSLDSTGGTDFESAYQTVLSALTMGGYAAGSADVIFLSDGQAGGGFEDEVTQIRDTLGHNVRAFGVGTGSSLAQLTLMDPAAEQFTNTNELLAAFGGGGGGGVGGDFRGFDQLAVFGWSTELGGKRWLIDTNSDGVINTGEGDILTMQPLVAGFDIAGALPIAGNFDGNADNGDEIGLYFAGQWALDTNRDFVIGAGDLFLSGNLLGHPVVGDFDGNGDDDLAVFNNNVLTFDMNVAGFDGNADQSFNWGFPGVLDRPVAADMDQDGIDDIGLWVPRNSAQANRPIAEWYFLVSAGATPVPGTVAALNHPFEIPPFGNDIYAEFGDELALPIVGNFDPPVAASTDNNGGLNTQGNDESADINDDGTTDGFDFLILQQNNGDGGPSGGSVAMWQDEYGQGVAATASVNDSDFNADGTVNGDDLGMWQSDFGQSLGSESFLAWQQDFVSTPTVAAATAPSSALNLNSGLNLAGVTGLGQPGTLTAAVLESAFEGIAIDLTPVEVEGVWDEAPQSPRDEAFADETLLKQDKDATEESEAELAEQLVVTYLV